MWWSRGRGHHGPSKRSWVKIPLESPGYTFEKKMFNLTAPAQMTFTEKENGH